MSFSLKILDVVWECCLLSPILILDVLTVFVVASLLTELIVGLRGFWHCPFLCFRVFEGFEYGFASFGRL